MSKTNNNEPTIEELKRSLDIVEVAEKYGELVKSGSNYKFKHDNSIVINPIKQIVSDFNGGLTGGSVLDLIIYLEKIELSEGIKRLKELCGQEHYRIDPAKQIQRKEEAKKKKSISFEKLHQISENELNDARDKHKRPLEYHNTKDQLTHYMFTDSYIKLFEREKIEYIYERKLNYIFNNIVGWNDFFQCPSIMIHDDNQRVVDIIAYRPNKPEHYENWNNPKYIYKNSHNRGENFLFPFRKEFEHIANKSNNSDRYIIVGEGIKNGLNALLYSMPFITLESSSNKLSSELINYIRSYHEKGFGIATMFDGDEAGRKAHQNFMEQTGLIIDNFLKFDSDMDFIDYLLSEGK
jgi:hypothetical protein